MKVLILFKIITHEFLYEFYHIDVSDIPKMLFVKLLKMTFIYISSVILCKKIRYL